MAGTHVTIAVADGGTFDSYVAAPAAGKGAGVVIVSTISGVDSDMTHYADTLDGGRVCRVRPRHVLARRRPGSAALDRRRAQARLCAQ